mmetsp:Transcript_11659/g.35582  ORF Transcript_11659/g.35582 Transcript_11659/m.35582 type:complete len:90 (-) Transcript_11659:1008-1277(-)
MPGHLQPMCSEGDGPGCRSCRCAAHELSNAVKVWTSTGSVLLPEFGATAIKLLLNAQAGLYGEYRTRSAKPTSASGATMFHVLLSAPCD